MWGHLSQWGVAPIGGVSYGTHARTPIRSRYTSANSMLFDQGDSQHVGAQPCCLVRRGRRASGMPQNYGPGGAARLVGMGSWRPAQLLGAAKRRLPRIPSQKLRCAINEVAWVKPPGDGTAGPADRRARPADCRPRTQPRADRGDRQCR